MNKLMLLALALLALGCEDQMATKPTYYTEVATAPVGTLPSGAAKAVRPAASYRSQGWSENEGIAVNNFNWNGQNAHNWEQWFDAALARSATKVVRSADSDDHAADYVCDGTDDQVQIQAAIDAVNAMGTGGGVVQLSRGVFTIKAGITFPGDTLVLMGSGPGTIIRVDATATTDFNVLTIDGRTNVVVMNLAIDGNIAGGHGHFHSGIQVTGASAGTVLERLYLRNFAMSGGSTYGYGIDIMGPSVRARVVNSTTYDCRNYGIRAESNTVQLTLIQGNVLRAGGSGGGGIYAAGGPSTQILGNILTGLGLVVSNSGDPAPPVGVRVIGNVITAAPGVGLYMRGSRHQVNDNYIQNSGDVGIWAEQADLSQIEDNIVDTTQVAGILLDDCDFIKVAGNTIVDVSQAVHNTSDYVSINDGQSADVHGNTMRATVGVTGRYGVWEDPANAPAATLCYGNYIGGAGASGTVLLIPGVGEAGAGTGITLPHVLWDPVAVKWVGDSTIVAAALPDAVIIAPAVYNNVNWIAALGQAPQRAAQLANY